MYCAEDTNWIVSCRSHVAQSLSTSTVVLWLGRLVTCGSGSGGSARRKGGKEGGCYLRVVSSCDVAVDISRFVVRNAIS